MVSASASVQSVLSQQRDQEGCHGWDPGGAETEGKSDWKRRKSFRRVSQMLSVSALQVCHALLLSLSAVSVSLVCEEDGTEVDSDEFLMTLPNNTTLMALRPGQAWRPQPVCSIPKKKKVRRCALGREFTYSVSDLPGFSRAQISSPRQATHREGHRSRHL